MMDQSIRVCIKRQGGVAIRAESGGDATVGYSMTVHARKGLKRVAFSGPRRYRRTAFGAFNLLIVTQC